jgi:ADP-heptose:LPS heptosyltransferase
VAEWLKAFAWKADNGQKPFVSSNLIPSAITLPEEISERGQIFDFTRAVMTRILLIKLGAFGDVIQCDGALRDIRAYHRDAHITVLTTPTYKKIFERCPHVNAVLIDPRAPRWNLAALYRLRASLHAGQFNLVYDLQNAARTRFYRRWLLPQPRWSQHTPDKTQPALERLAAQLTAAGVTPTHTPQPDVSWLCEDMSTDMAAAGVTTPYIVLIPWCSARHPDKRWPHFEELARRLLAEGRCVVTAPGPDELSEADSFPGLMMKGPRGFYNWFELAHVLKGAQFVIGNDTGPSHLAAHIGAPGLALYGPHTSAVRTSIEREKFRAIEVPDLAALSVDTVWKALHDRLS